MPGKIRGLFRWCLKVTEGYAGVELVDMTTSWKNGLAFCAIINRFRPDLLDFYSLSPVNVYENNDLAFSVMEKEYNIPRLLDPRDMVEMEAPDRYSIATYVSAFYECFNDKPMCDPPPVPENWNSEKNTQQKKLPDQLKQEQKEPSTSVNVNAHSNKGYDISMREEENSSIACTNKSVDLDKTVKTDIDSSSTKSNVTVDDDCDIDDLYSKSINLLGDEEDTDLETKQEYTYKDLCQTSIEDIKSSKKGVVLQAMVLAGVTAVAATTIGDDTVNDDKESVTEKTTLDNNSTFVKQHEDLKESLKSALDTFSESRDISGETTESDTDFNPNDTDFRTDDSFADSGCDLTSVLTCTTELEGADLNNTGASVNLENHLEKGNEPSYPDKEHSSFEGEESDQLPTHGIISNENGTKLISIETEHTTDECPQLEKSEEDTDKRLIKQSSSDPCDVPFSDSVVTKETVEILNYELNNGEYQITDVNVIDDAGISISGDKPLYQYSDAKMNVSCDKQLSLPISKESVSVEKESYPNISDYSVVYDNGICSEGFQPIDTAEGADLEKNPDLQLIQTETKVSESSDEDGHSKNSNGAITIDESVSSEKLVKMDREQIQYDHLENKVLKDSFNDLTKEKDYDKISSPGSQSLPPVHKLNEVIEDSAVGTCILEYEKDFDMRQNYTVAQSVLPEKEHDFAENMATEILNNVLETVKLNQDFVDAGKDTAAMMQETEIDSESKGTSKDSTGVEISEMQVEGIEPQSSFSNEDGKSDDAVNHNDEEVKHIISPARRNSSFSSSSQDCSGTGSPPPELPSVGPPSLIKAALIENSDIQADQLHTSSSITLSPLEITFQNISVDESCGIMANTDLETEVKFSTDLNLENALEQPVELSKSGQQPGPNVYIVDTKQPYADNLCLKDSFEQDVQQKTKFEVEFMDSKNDDSQKGENDLSFVHEKDSSNIRGEKQSIYKQNIHADEQIYDTETERSEPRVSELEVCSAVALMPNQVEREKSLKNNNDETNTEIFCSEAFAADTNVIDTDGSLNDKMIQETESEIEISNSKKENVINNPQESENNTSCRDDEGSLNAQHVSVDEKPSPNEQNVLEDEQVNAVESNLSESKVMELEVCSLVTSMPNQVGKENDDLQSCSDNGETNDEIPGPESLSADANITETDGSLNDKTLQETESKVRISALKKEIVNDDQLESGISYKDDEGSLNVQHGSVDEKPTLNEKKFIEDDQYKDIEPNLCESKAMEFEVCSPITLTPKHVGKESKSLQNHSNNYKTNNEAPSSESLFAEAGITGTNSSLNDEMEINASKKEIVNDDPQENENDISFKDDVGSLNIQLISVDEKRSLYEDEQKQGIEPNISESKVLGLEVSTPASMIPEKTAVQNEFLKDLCNSDRAGKEIPDSGTFSTDASIAKTVLPVSENETTVHPKEKNVMDLVLNDTEAISDSMKTEVPDDAFISTNGIISEKDKTVVDSVEAVMGDVINEQSVKALPVRIGEVKLDWSTKVSDPNGNIAKEVSLELTAPISSVGDPTEVPQPTITEKSYADIDKDLLRKAAIMSRKMAEKVTSKIIEDQSLGEECIEANYSTQEKDFETPVTPPPTPVPSQDSAKERRQAMFQFLQNSTRPTKKKFDEEDEISVDEKSVDFATKMKMWNRRSFTNTDQLHKVSTETAPKKRISLTSPFLENENKSTEEKDRHLARLTKILPDKPAPGSVAEYIRKISESKSPKSNEEVFSNRFARFDSDTASEKGNDRKEYITSTFSKDSEVDQVDKPKDGLDEQEVKPFSKDVNPSTIFSARPLVRMRSKNQNVKLPIRPLSVEVKYQEEITEASKPPIPPARLSRRKLGRVNVEVQPIEKMSEVQDDSWSSNNEKDELKHQDSIKRKNSPRRSLSLSSPTRSDSRSNSQERDRNIWITSNEKPPSPKLKRNDSFEVKVRPVTSQKSPQEKAEAKKEKEIDLQNSSQSSDHPLTPSKNLPKISVSVRPLSAKERDEDLQKDGLNTSVKGGRRSLLSLVSSIKESKQEKSPKEIAEKADQASDKETNNGEKAKDKSNIGTLNGRFQTSDQDLFAKKPSSKFYSLIKTVVQNDKESKKELESLEDGTCINDEVGHIVVEPFYSCVSNEISAELQTELEATYQTGKVLPMSDMNIEPQVKTKSEPTDCLQNSYQRQKEEAVRKCNSIFGSGKSMMADLEHEDAYETGENVSIDQSNSSNDIKSSDNCHELEKNRKIDDNSVPDATSASTFIRNNDIFHELNIDGKSGENFDLPKSSTSDRSIEICFSAENKEQDERGEHVKQAVQEKKVSQGIVSEDGIVRQAFDENSDLSSSTDESLDNKQKGHLPLNSSAEIDKTESKDGLEAVIREKSDEIEASDPRTFKGAGITPSAEIDKTESKERLQTIVKEKPHEIETSDPTPFKDAEITSCPSPFELSTDQTQKEKESVTADRSLLPVLIENDPTGLKAETEFCDKVRHEKPKEDFLTSQRPALISKKQDFDYPNPSMELEMNEPVTNRKREDCQIDKLDKTPNASEQHILFKVSLGVHSNESQSGEKVPLENKCQPLIEHSKRTDDDPVQCQKLGVGTEDNMNEMSKKKTKKKRKKEKCSDSSSESGDSDTDEGEDESSFKGNRKEIETCEHSKPSVVSSQKTNESSGGEQVSDSKESHSTSEGDAPKEASEFYEKLELPIGVVLKNNVTDIDDIPQPFQDEKDDRHFDSDKKHPVPFKNFIFGMGNTVSVSVKIHEKDFPDDRNSQSVKEKYLQVDPKVESVENSDAEMPDQAELMIKTMDTTNIASLGFDIENEVEKNVDDDMSPSLKHDSDPKSIEGGIMYEKYEKASKEVDTDFLDTSDLKSNKDSEYSSASMSSLNQQNSSNEVQNTKIQSDPENYLDAETTRNEVLLEHKEKGQEQDRSKVEKPDILQNLPAREKIIEEVGRIENSDEASILEKKKDIEILPTTGIEQTVSAVNLRSSIDPESVSSCESEKQDDVNLKEENIHEESQNISPENASEILDNIVSRQIQAGQTTGNGKGKEYKEVLVMSIRLNVEGEEKKVKEDGENKAENVVFDSKDERDVKSSTSSESELDFKQGIHSREYSNDKTRGNNVFSRNADVCMPTAVETKEKPPKDESSNPKAKDSSSNVGGDFKQKSSSNPDEKQKDKGKVKKKRLARKSSSDSRDSDSEVSSCASDDGLKTELKIGEISHRKPIHSSKQTPILNQLESISSPTEFEVELKKTIGKDDKKAIQSNSNTSLKDKGYHADSESSDTESNDSDKKAETPAVQVEHFPVQDLSITLKNRTDEIGLFEITKDDMPNQPEIAVISESVIPVNFGFDSEEFSGDKKQVNKELAVISSAHSTFGSAKEMSEPVSDKLLILPTQDAIPEQSQTNGLSISHLQNEEGKPQQMANEMVMLEDNDIIHLAIGDQVPKDIIQGNLTNTRKASQTSTSSSSSCESDSEDDAVISDIEEAIPRKGKDDKKEKLEQEKYQNAYGNNVHIVSDDLLLTVEQGLAKETYLLELKPESLKDIKQESVSTGDHEHEKEIVNDIDDQQDNMKYGRRPSCSSHTSNSSTDSNVKDNKLDEVKVDDQEDDLLKIVIEDSQPFRAPLLETMIDSNIKDDNNELEKTISSEDLYSIDRKTENDDIYLLPECNVIGTEYDHICLKEKELPFNILDIEYKPDPIDIQVFVIPDGPVNVPLTENLDSKEVILLGDEKLRGDMDYDSAIVMPTEQLGNVHERDQIFYDEFNQDDYLSPRQLNEIVLEPILDGKQTDIEQIEGTYIEDGLLQSIIQGQKMVPVRRRKKSESSSSSSSDESKGETENYCDVDIIDDHVYQTLGNETKHDADIQQEDFEDGEIYEDINESELKDYDRFKTNSTELTDRVDTGGHDINKQNDVVSWNKDATDRTTIKVFEENVDWKEETLEDCGKEIEKLDKASDTPGESVGQIVQSSSSSSSSDSEEEDKVISKSESGTNNEINEYGKKVGKKDDNEKIVERVIESQIIPDSITLQEASTQQKHGHEEESNFMIGREKDPSKSEVARLIQQSLELDRKREEQRRLEQERLQEQVQPRDEVLERDHHRHLSDSQNHIDREEENVDLDESSIEDEVDAEEKEISSEQFSGQFSEDCQAGEATPISMPSGLDTDNSVSSPEEGASKPVVEVFDLQESSSEDISPDMEAQALFVKLKEAQCKIAVLEAEVAKLKARLIVLENAEAQKKQLEKKNEEMASRLRETEKSLTNARKEINHYQDLLEGSQGQYIKLEKKMSGDFTALEKKYHKAKKLIKEYQQREKDFLAERESLVQQQTEKDQQYNALVKSLKDKIFLLEGDLRQAQKAAGLPVSDPSLTSQKIEPIVTPVSVQPVKSAPPVHDSGSPLLSPLVDKDSVSSESETSSADIVSPEGEIKAERVDLFESMPVTQPLDTSVSKAKAQVANNSRRPPTKQRSKSQDSDEMMDYAASANKDESGLETWIKHDSDNTVKKSDVRKRKAQQLGSDTQTPPATALETESLTPSVPVSETDDLGTEEKLPPPTPPPSNPQTSLPESDLIDAARERGDSESGDSSSTVSQSSYDPSKPNFRSKDSEIPSSVENTDTHDTESESSSISAKKSKGFNLPKLPFKFGAGERDKGGVMLISSRTLNTGEDSTTSEGGITLISKRKLDTGIDFDGASIISTISDTSSGYMVGEQESTSYSFSGTPANEDHPSQASPHVQNQFHSCPIADWNVEHVRNWLIGIEMDKYIPLFTEKSVTGLQLVNLDTNKMKAIGIASSKDRDLLKKKVKELKLVLDKERKQQEKERKLFEKEQKAKEKEQKKMSKKK